MTLKPFAITVKPKTKRQQVRLYGTCRFRVMRPVFEPMEVVYRHMPCQKAAGSAGFCAEHQWLLDGGYRGGEYEHRRD